MEDIQNIAAFAADDGKPISMQFSFLARNRSSLFLTVQRAETPLMKALTEKNEHYLGKLMFFVSILFRCLLAVILHLQKLDRGMDMC